MPRSLYLSETLGGAFILNGTLDAEGGAILKTALESIIPAARDHDRTPAQRRHDALVDLGRFLLDYGDLPTSHGESPHVSVVVPQSTLEGREGAPGAELAWAGVIPGATAQRLACDASISVVTLDASGNPVGAGKASKVIPASLWRALVVRDRGCVECGLAPCWTDAHHRIPREHGGKTVLENLELRCRKDHRFAHKSHRRFARTRDGGIEDVPP